MSMVLITGASGFLGTEVCSMISKEHNIYTLGRTQTAFKNIEADLSNRDILLPEVSFEHIVHLAGKAHSYPKTKEEIEAFNLVNYEGTINVLNALDNQKSIKTFVFASTVAVYGVEFGENIRESFPTNPTTPYGKSKLSAEQYIIDWCKKKNISYLILRLPLVAGNNPPGNLGALKRAIKKGYYIKIKGNQAQKSIVLATDIAHLIAKFNWVSGIYNLTDGINPTFAEIECAIEKSQNKRVRLNVPLKFLKRAALIGDFLQKIKINIPINTLKIKKITSSLTFNDEKAIKELNWKPNSAIEYLSNN
jgi:GlcNAc-P-P-Und epimerase